MNQKEIDFIIGVLEKIKSSNLKEDSAEIQDLWNNLFVYAGQHINKEEKLGLLSKIDVNVQDLKEYLKIDVPKVVDYSFIQDEKIRNQLQVDCYEMSKYRYGKINNKIDFYEYCRYAMLQIELISNYFVNKQNFKSFIGDHYPRVKTPNNQKDESKKKNIDKAKKAEDIWLDTKINAIQNYFNIKGNIKSNIYKIKEIRNQLSHRSSYQKKKEDDILSEFLANGLDGKNYRDLGSQDDLKLFNAGNEIIFKRNQRWDEVDKALKKYVNNIKEDLERNQSDKQIHIKSY